jgi:predicted RNA-binding protein associated with RNAse of E/G family
VEVRTVTIHYRRLPDRDRVFEQLLVDETEDYVVTLLEAAPLSAPVTVAGASVLEPGAPVVWFTYPGRWYDIGRFHLADGTFTGIYANILTPVRMRGDHWETTDLCLDVWAETDGRVEILDEAEFELAVANGWMDDATAQQAREQARSLAAAAKTGAWPPQHVTEWNLERARARIRGTEEISR